MSQKLWSLYLFCKLMVSWVIQCCFLQHYNNNIDEYQEGFSVTDPRNIETTQEDYDEKSMKMPGLETMDTDNPFWRDSDDPGSDSFRFDLTWDYIECLDFGS